MIFAMSCISLLGSVVWGHHMYTVGLETDTRAYFTGVTILISLPTGTKIFNWLSTYLGNPPLLQLKTSSAFFGLLFLLMFTIGGSTGIILGNAAVDLGLHDTYYVVAHFHFVLSLGAVIAIFSGIIFIGEKIVGSKILLPSSSSTLSLYHLVSTFIGILLTFSPMHFLGFNVMPRRIPDFPDSFHSWNFLSSIGSGITFLSFAMLFFLESSISKFWEEKKRPRGKKKEKEFKLQWNFLSFAMLFFFDLQIPETRDYLRPAYLTSFGFFCFSNSRILRETTGYPILFPFL